MQRRWRATRIANFIYTGLIGKFNQWLATRDRPQLMATLDNLVRAAQMLADGGIRTA